ncbi:MAG: tetratricopeptide repeat protein [Myxococcota bacterium]
MPPSMENDPDRGLSREAQARAHANAGRSHEAAQAWSEVAAERPPGPERAAALVEQARLTSDPEVTALLHRRALANDPGHAASLDALTRHARTQQQWLLLANLYRLRFQQEEDPKRRAGLALEAGRLELEHLHSPGAARSWFRDGLECDPEKLEIVAALVELERTRGDDAALLVALERLIELRDGEPAPSELLEAASLRSARGEMARALVHLERASARAPEDVLVLEALAEVLAALDRLTELADVLERRAAVTDDEELRAGVLMELGALLEERLFDPEAALDAYQRAARDDPRAPGARDAVSRLQAKLETAAESSVERGGGEEASETPEAWDRALADLEREAHTTNDRSRLGLLVREIESLQRKRGTPELALPWVQRWAVAAPEDPEALRALARIHQQPGHEVELTATLEALDPLLDLNEQASNRRQLAALYESRGRLDDAVRSYERALDVEPRHLETLESLQTLLRDRGDTQKLVGVLQRILDLREPRQRAACLLDIAELQEELGDVAGAIATRSELERDERSPGDSEERLDALLEVAGRHDEIEARLRQRRETFDPGSAEWVALELRRAQILGERLDRPEDAADAFRAILQHAPESPEAKSGLERSLRASIDADGLAEFLEAQAAEATDDAERDRATLERAVLLEEVLDRDAEAREAYRALATGADDAELRADASFRYERLLQNAGEWEALRDHLELSLSRAAPSQRAALHERLARICGDPLRDEAAELRHLEQLAELDPARGDVWRVLSERYEQTDRAENQIHAMEQEIAAGCDVGRSLTLHARLAELHLQVRRDPDAAREHYERVFELDPSHAAAAQYLIGRYDEDRRPEEVIRVLESRLATLGPVTEDAARREVVSHRTALRVHIANVRAQQLDDVEGAISALEVALGEAGPTAQIAEPLAACYQRAGYSLDLIELSRSAAAACDEPGEAANWYVRMGDAFLARDRPREAADAFRQALTERPDDRAVQASLRAIYRKLGDTLPLVGLLDAELSHLAGADEVPVRMELAALQALVEERRDDALLHVQRVLQLVPRHAEAFERALALAGQLGRNELALDLIENRIEHAGTRTERAELLGRRADLLAGPFAQPDDAIESLRASLAAAPDTERREQLADLLAQEGRHAEWLDVVGEQARDAADPEARIALLERAVSVAWQQLSPDDALPWLERLASERPDDVEPLLRIAQAHRSAGRTESLLRTLTRATGRTRNPTQRRNLQLERAALLELELEAPGRAHAALEDARTAAPEDPEVLGRLERLQAVLSRHGERAATLETLLRVSPEDALDLHRELARLHGGALRDPARAVDHWRAALEIAEAGDPTDPVRIDILHALSDTYRRDGDLERWAETAERELAALGQAPVFDDRRREIRRELALAYHGELARPGEALRHGRALLDAGEDDLLGSETLDRIESLVLALLRQAGALVELETRLTRHLARRPENAERWLELARLREEQLQSTAAAIDAYRRTLELEPDSLAARRGLRTAAERLGRHEDVADALERELEHPESQDPDMRGGLLRRLGDVYWHRLQSTTRASRCYAAALEANGADFAALRALERLLEAMEDWRGALDLYESEVEVLGEDDPQRRSEIWLHVAELARDHTDDVERARRALLNAADLEPLAPGHLRDLAELHDRAGDTDAFAGSFAAWCDTEGVEPTAEDALRLSDALAALDRPQEALDRARQAVGDEDATPDAWDRVAALHERIGRPGEAADALREAARCTSDAEATARLEHGARLVADEDPALALDLLREAVRRQPDAVAVHAERARLALASDALAEAEEAAAAALDRDAHRVLDDAERLEIALIGGDAARAAGRLEIAAGFYGRARDCDETDPRASGSYGEVLAELGDTGHARAALEARVALGDDYPQRAAHRATLALCLETEGDVEGALDAALAALEDDPHQEVALGVRVRAHEALGHLDEAVEATLRWAAAAGDAATRGERLLRCAEWEMRSGECEEQAEAHVRQALAANPEQPQAWILLASLLLGQGRLGEAVECTDRAAAHTPADDDLGTLALLQGRAREQQGDRSRAAEAFGLAAEAEPRCTEAALAQARLLRGAGEWRAAAEALETFLARHPNPDHASLADVHEQLARLLAGPLEDVDGAVSGYRRAIALAPDPLAPRAALADLLSHRSGDRAEALEHVRHLLQVDPTDAATLRVALRLARGPAARSADAKDAAGADVGTGLAVLRALGLASAYEVEEAERAAGLALPEGLADPHFERLRAVAVLAADAIAQALEASEHPDAPDAGDATPEAGFRAVRLRIEGELAAPALVPLPTEELAEVLRLVVRLSVDPDAVRGDGRRVNALSEALRRRQRRRLKKEIGDVAAETLCAIDFEHWRTELRALAAARALAECDADLRTALLCLARDEAGSLDREIRDEANVAACVARSEVAKALLRRVLGAWLERLT